MKLLDSNKPVSGITGAVHTCDAPYSTLSVDDICREVFDFHEQTINLYRTLVGKAEIPEAKELLDSLLALEEHEAMRLVRQTGRMNDV
ncbi:hypothetical protein [Vreelandella aquamarina]|uniref:hypothetical protein n=1 Tax=Vreelandella aquamarina TaxID=77097 RepID=UPI0020C538E4|nr:hypothetical protein [Halomonas meridiana]